MKRFFNRLAEIFEMSFTIRHIDLNQPIREAELTAIRDKYESR